MGPGSPTKHGNGLWGVNVPVRAPSSPTGAGSGDGLPQGALYACNDFGERAYGGPARPAGDRAHRYLPAVHALDVAPLELTANASPAYVGSHRHLLGWVGTFGSRILREPQLQSRPWCYAMSAGRSSL